MGLSTERIVGQKIRIAAFSQSVRNRAQVPLLCAQKVSEIGFARYQVSGKWKENENKNKYNKSKISSDE